MYNLTYTNGELAHDGDFACVVDKHDHKYYGILKDANCRVFFLDCRPTGSLMAFSRDDIQCVVLGNRADEL